MIRRILLVVIPGLALTAAAMFPFVKSDASLQPGNSRQDQAGLERKALPNFDIRLAGRAGFDDYDLSSNAGRQNSYTVIRRNSHARLKKRDVAIRQSN